MPSAGRSGRVAASRVPTFVRGRGRCPGPPFGPPVPAFAQRWV